MRRCWLEQARGSVAFDPQEQARPEFERHLHLAQVQVRAEGVIMHKRTTPAPAFVVGVRLHYPGVFRDALLGGI